MCHYGDTTEARKKQQAGLGLDMECLLDDALAGLSQPESSSRLLGVQMESNNEWDSSGAHIWTSTL